MGCVLPKTQYRELFKNEFSEVSGFKAFAAQAKGAGFVCGIGTASDKHNIAFAIGHLNMSHAPAANFDELIASGFIQHGIYR
jgi:hypothetical protein